MRRFGNPLLSIAAPLLILIGSLGLIQREGRDRVQSLPAICIGSGFIVVGWLRRSRRRKMLLLEIKKTNDQENI